MDLSGARSPKQLEDENVKLKRLVADVTLDNVVRKDHPISQRRVCVLIGVDPKTAMRRIGVVLERVGKAMNANRLSSIYREECLPVRPRRGRNRKRASRTPMPVPLRPTQSW